jgi:type II secretory ATPase GspE/PulE/Tfp pilus assembly ATPase PilB-like protein
MAIHEVMEITNDIREMILKGAPGYEIQGAARENGMKTLRQDGLAKVTQGLTTIDEILKITQEV